MQELVLRDIHQPPAPPWWPPAPGWWIVAAVTLLALALLLWMRARRRRHRLAVARLFDDAVAAAATTPGKIAAMSELLRRASRRRDPDADRLQGEAWLQFLDTGLSAPAFADGAGRILLEGGFRREVGDVEFDALQRIARDRFLEWMAARR